MSWLAGLLVGVGYSQAGLPHTSRAPAEQVPARHLQIFCRQYPIGDKSVPAEVSKKLNAPAQREVKDLHGTIWQATPQGLIPSGLRSQMVIGPESQTRQRVPTSH